MRLLEKAAGCIADGCVMEVAERDNLYTSPMHPYTQAMLNPAPVPDR